MASGEEAASPLLQLAKSRSTASRALILNRHSTTSCSVDHSENNTTSNYLRRAVQLEPDRVVRFLGARSHRAELSEIALGFVDCDLTTSPRKRLHSRCRPGACERRAEPMRAGDVHAQL